MKVIKIIYKISIVLILITIFPIYFSIRNANEVFSKNIINEMDNNALKFSENIKKVILDYQNKFLLNTRIVANSGDLQQSRNYCPDTEELLI